MNIVDLIKSEAKRQGVSLSEIARRMEMSQQSLNQMLKAESIKFSAVQKIADVLNVSISHLLNENYDSDKTANVSTDRMLSIIESQQRAIENFSIYMVGKQDIAGSATIARAGG
jgi:transcriptional regulator with XRE-family HTH domain